MSSDSIHTKVRTMEEWKHFYRDTPIFHYLENQETMIAVANTASFTNFTQTGSADRPLIPDSSLSNTNIFDSTICVPKIENNFLFEQQGMVDTIEFRRCLICRMEISKHETELGGLHLYYCLQCTFNKEYQLKQKHRSIPRPFYCVICEVRYSELDFHGEATCNVCKQNFECIVQIEEHYSINENHHSNHCMVCGNSFGDHENGKISVEYNCCYCGCKYKNSNKNRLLDHIASHLSIKLFKCRVCGERLKQEPFRVRHVRKLHSSK